MTTKIIAFFDAHHGPDKEASNASDVYLHGTKAIPVIEAIYGYIQREGDVDIVYSGGDESSFVADTQRPHHHFSRATMVGDIINYLSSIVTSCYPTLIRGIGNHDPIGHLQELGFNPRNSIHDINATRILALQPEVKQTKDKTHYRFYPDNKLDIGFLTKRTEKYNILATGHWAFDRRLRGYPQIYKKSGYISIDDTQAITTKLQDFSAGVGGRVLSLHGHEHRFSLSDVLGFECMVMPSIVQADIDDEGKPCGLFVEITDSGPKGTLNYAFKKVVLNTANPEKSEICDVPLNYMQRYYRPVTLNGLVIA